MTGLAGTAPDESARGLRARAGDALRATEVDLRLFGMVLALIVIWVGLGLANSIILQPVNFLTFSVQAASTAVLATGMVLVIVSRNIDLSVGSVVGLIGMGYAVFMADIVPTTLGLDNPFGWIIALGLGIAFGALIGAFQGFLIAYAEIPSFVVTLGGLLGFRGLIWQFSGGTTVAPNLPTFNLLGGGPEGSLGGVWAWLLGALISVPPSCSYSTPVEPSASTASQSGRCGPKSRLRSCRSAPSSRASLSPIRTIGRPASRPSTRSPTGSLNRRKASRSRRAFRSRS